MEEQQDKVIQEEVNVMLLYNSSVVAVVVEQAALDKMAVFGLLTVQEDLAQAGLD